MIVEKTLLHYNRLFQDHFGTVIDKIAVRSPGRVNLIGEHTDYNGGFVLPAAVDKSITLVVGRRDGTKCRLFAADLNEGWEFDLANIARSPKGWPNYVMGVVEQMRQGGYAFGAFDCVFGGNVPIGAGMSSSAAIEGGVAYALNDLFELGIDSLTLVKMAQKAENLFVGVQCGIMDQFVNIYGQEKKVLKLDCRSLHHEYFPFERTDLRIVLCDTNVRRALASSEYNVRRRECEDGVTVLRQFQPLLRSLRDVTLPFLEEHRSGLLPVVYSRCRYVVEENGRVQRACEHLQQNDFRAFGERMYESHKGLRDEYQVSCHELDELVEIASSIDGVYGARMMGAGFGGCTINIVEEQAVARFASIIRERYRSSMGTDPIIHSCMIHSGTGKIVENPSFVKSFS